MKKILAIVALICSLVFASAPLANVYAEETSIKSGDIDVTFDPNYSDPSGKIPGGDGNGEDEVGKRVETIVGVLALLVGVVSVIMIIWGGIMYSYSAGDPGKAQLAKRIIVSAIIGLVLSILSGVILSVVVTVSQGGTI